MTRVNHIGINVGDLDAAVTWYQKVFGFTVLVDVGTHTLDTSNGERRKDVFGPEWRAMKLAHLATPDGVGIELFQFLDPAYVASEDSFEYWRQGIFHVCFTVDDLSDSLALLTEAGGKVRTQVHQIRPGTAVAYCEDPWGTIIELSSGTYGQIVGTE